jgi:hypothetical protein
MAAMFIFIIAMSIVIMIAVACGWVFGKEDL